MNSEVFTLTSTVKNRVYTLYEMIISLGASDLFLYKWKRYILFSDVVQCNCTCILFGKKHLIAKIFYEDSVGSSASKSMAKNMAPSI